MQRVSDDNEFEAEPDAPYEADVILDVAYQDESDVDVVERALLEGDGIPGDEAQQFVPPDDTIGRPIGAGGGSGVPETGDPRVDEVLRGLAPLDSLPTSEHVGVYDEVHRGLQDALANLDQG